jgi:hypothetical protein
MVPEPRDRLSPDRCLEAPRSPGNNAPPRRSVYRGLSRWGLDPGTLVRCDRRFMALCLPKSMVWQSPCRVAPKSSASFRSTVPTTKSISTERRSSCCARPAGRRRATLPRGLNQDASPQRVTQRM